MELLAEERLETSRLHAYLIGDCRQATPWYRLYSARKVFFNYRFERREFYEADANESVDVLVRVCEYPASAKTDEVRQRQQLLHYEATQVLSTQTGWFPEPLDWLELTPEKTTTGNIEPVLVMSRLHGEPLHRWRERQPVGSADCLRVADEILDLLDCLHERGQVLGGISPEDFLIDEQGRLQFMATDRVVPLSDSIEQRAFYPPERYPSGFAAPEAYDPTARLDVRSDLFSWGALCLYLVANQKPDRTATSESRAPLEYGDTEQELLETALKAAASAEPDILQVLSQRQGRYSGAEMIAAWSMCLRRCLATDSAERPSSVGELRDLATVSSRSSPSRSLLGSLWRRLVTSRFAL